MSPVLTNYASHIEFSAKNLGLSNMVFEVEVSENGIDNWMTVETLTNKVFNHKYRMKISFPGYTKSGPLTNFPALVVFNLPRVQRGLKAMKQPSVIFADYGESKVRHFHKLLEEWIAKP